MIIETATGKKFNCSAITSIPSPARLYLHLTGTTLAKVTGIFKDTESELPIMGYEDFKVVQSISPEGGTNVKVSLKKS